MAVLWMLGGGLGVFVVCVLGMRYRINGGLYRRNCKHVKVSLQGKTAIITGGNSGIGKETAIDLARRGARVIVACRNPKRAETALKEIRSRSGSSNVVYRHLELSDQSSVRTFAEEFLKEELRLDLLINNAGIARHPKGHRTKEGYDMTFATNHFGHFLLTLLLLDHLKKSSPSRIINVSSCMHAGVKPGKMHFAAKDAEGIVYPGLRGYDMSKLANVLFTKELDRRLEGSGVTTYALHPGTIRSNLIHASVEATGGSWIIEYIVLGIFTLFGSNEESGAQTTIYCALEESITNLSGGYFDNCRLAKESELARDAGLAKKLWDVSCQATGLED